LHKITKAKKASGCASNARAFTWQVQSPEFKSLYCQKQKRRKRKTYDAGVTLISEWDKKL
jgi:hypothetical protein